VRIVTESETEAVSEMEAGSETEIESEMETILR
jgi:hypothetical protein